MIDSLGTDIGKDRFDPGLDTVQGRQHLLNVCLGKQCRGFKGRHGSVRIKGCCRICFLGFILQHAGIQIQKLFFHQSHCFIGTGFTGSSGTAEPAPVSGDLLTFSFKGQLCPGSDIGLRPVQQFLHTAFKR